MFDFGHISSKNEPVQLEGCGLGSRVCWCSLKFLTPKKLGKICGCCCWGSRPLQSSLSESPLFALWVPWAVELQPTMRSMPMTNSRKTERRPAPFFSVGTVGKLETLIILQDKETLPLRSFYRAISNSFSDCEQSRKDRKTQGVDVPGPIFFIPVGRFVDLNLRFIPSSIRILTAAIRKNTTRISTRG